MVSSLVVQQQPMRFSNLGVKLGRLLLHFFVGGGRALKQQMLLALQYLQQCGAARQRLSEVVTCNTQCFDIIKMISNENIYVYARRMSPFLRFRWSGTLSSDLLTPLHQCVIDVEKSCRLVGQHNRPVGKVSKAQLSDSHQRPPAARHVTAETRQR